MRMHHDREKSFPQWRIRHEAHIEVTASLDISALWITRPKRILDLQRRDGMNLACAPDRVGARFRQADVASEATLHQPRHCTHRLFDRNIRIDARHAEYV